MTAYFYFNAEMLWYLHKGAAVERSPVDIRRWATRRLRSGDLTALRGVLRGQRIHHEDGRLDRLRQRGFIKFVDTQKVQVTSLGWAALLVKQFALF